jgi:hypothetical protein
MIYSQKSISSTLCLLPPLVTPEVVSQLLIKQQKDENDEPITHTKAKEAFASLDSIQPFLPLQQDDIIVSFEGCHFFGRYPRM